MDRSELVRRLEEADQQVSHGMEMIASLRQTVAKVDAADVNIDAIMIAELETLQDINVQDRDKLRVELAHLRARK
jgi:hypothetical protein